jgi:hypothetical protein
MRAAKVDANHMQVVSALRAAGCLVESLAGVGKGVPDLLVGYENSAGELKFWMVEVKDGAKAKSAQALTPAQVGWHAKWEGYPVSIVDGPESALRHLAALKA